MTERISAMDMPRFIHEHRPSAGPRLASQLQDYLKVGLVTCTAKVARLTHRRFMAGQTPPEIEEICDFEVPAEMWGGNGSRLALMEDTFANPSAKGYSKVELIGLSFDLAQIKEHFRIDESLPPKKAISSGAKPTNVGAKVNPKQWELFAAALAHLHERGSLDLSNANGTRNKVAEFLATKGHPEALSTDTVRSLISRLGAWEKGLNYLDDEAE